MPLTDVSAPSILSPHDKINRLRIERAKQLLTDTDWTIERVAEACGFAASKRLYEAFMREEGKTLNSFRGSEDGSVHGGID
jgi:transcriptional regulator GlxA family with amidase domain